MGEEDSLQCASLSAYQIAITPVTNAQYSLYLMATGANPPEDWDGDLPPLKKENHPVVNVTWHDAMNYCQWLSKVTDQQITLPLETEWEKAARGDQDRRSYPWGDEFDPARANTTESEVGDTTPVGIYPSGASPYGALELSGNVWEWTRSVYTGYPNHPEEGREHLKSEEPRVLRGGSFDYDGWFARCNSRDWYYPDFRFRNVGFRVVVLQSTPDAL